jgi:hypothetical protein
MENKARKSPLNCVAINSTERDPDALLSKKEK